MYSIRKLFGGLDMTWKKLILFAILAGVYTGLINQVPILKNTSFTDIAVSYEVWILFAVIIGVNCKTPLESACKVFVFFLISQPLCFCVEIPSIGTAQAVFYLKMWVPQILMTFPGGFVVHFAKKDCWWGALVTLAAVLMEASFLAVYGSTVLFSFPGHLLTTLFCLLTILCFVCFLLSKNVYRILAIICAAVFTLYLGFHTSNVAYNYSASLPGKYTDYALAVKDGSYVEIDTKNASYTYYYYPYEVKDNTLTFTNASGEKAVIKVTVKNRTIELSEQ